MCTLNECCYCSNCSRFGYKYIYSTSILFRNKSNKRCFSDTKLFFYCIPLLQLQTTTGLVYLLDYQHRELKSDSKLHQLFDKVPASHIALSESQDLDFKIKIWPTVLCLLWAACLVAFKSMNNSRPSLVQPGPGPYWTWNWSDLSMLAGRFIQKKSDHLSLLYSISHISYSYLSNILTPQTAAPQECIYASRDLPSFHWNDSWDLGVRDK